ncbi:MAG: TonB-dependent receptor [Myxococcales bacterium]|nr:TonB-dependent receptor [Myxococcales bacterium]
MGPASASGDGRAPEGPVESKPSELEREGPEPVREEPAREEPARKPEREETERDADDDDDDDGVEVRTIVVEPRRPRPSEPDRASSVVTRAELDERQPRSTPDALRGEPGVYIQQTAHSQASPYLRGLTGQQTVMFFDGVRLNNSTFRQGPNQYFFTIDSRSIQQLEVIRGSGSTRWGADALGGVLLATPVEPTLDLEKKVAVHGRGIVRFATADSQAGGRAQTSVSLGGKLGLLVGAGYRDLGLLRSGGRIIAPGTGEPQTVPPVFEDDEKTQLGTGFREVTDDARLVWRMSRKHRFTLGYYDYRQLDAPRTDKCPPPTAPQDECLTYLHQFRTLAYGAYDHSHGPSPAERVRLSLSYQRQHELRQEDRGSSSPTELDGEDNVNSAGIALKLDTKEFALAPWVTFGVRYGVDAYYDRISSSLDLVYTSTGITSTQPRGQYLDGAQYLTSGVWAEAHTEFVDRVRLKAGGRGALVVAQADGEPETASEPVDRHWEALIGNVGIAGDATEWLTFVFNVDQGFRAPNLDDLTSRQQIGPGFQYENADLKPERSLSLELGGLVRHPWIELDAHVYRTTIRDLIQRTSRELEECPEGDLGCLASRNRWQLINYDELAVVMGAEGGVRLYLPLDLGARATISYAWGEGANPNAGRPLEPARVPLSRIPPLNGIGELGWRSKRFGAYAVGVVRWALAQTRLAPQDGKDARIPDGGTPGYVVLDIRGGYRFDPYILVGLTFENILDTAYRHHGSSVNGPGRGLMAEVQIGF